VNTLAGVHPDVREQLAGSWSLVSRVSTLANGEVLPDRGLATTPKGLLIYDRTGHVAPQLSRQGRTVEMIGEECQEAAKIRGTNDTAQTVLGYDAYFGTFTVNEKEGFVVHHLESALFPGDMGKGIKRNFTISGDKLTIKFNTTTSDGMPVKDIGLGVHEVKRRRKISLTGQEGVPRKARHSTVPRERCHVTMLRHGARDAATEPHSSGPVLPRSGQN
jgi:hypothetical protein